MSARTSVEILIVTSSAEAARRLQASLERHGHRVRATAGVAEALPLLEAQRVDWLVVECRLLEANGAALFHLLGRRPHPPMILPLVMPVASGASAALVPDGDGLEAALAQAQTLLGQRDATTLRIGDLAIDLATKRVTLHGRHVALPPIQFRLLLYLTQNAGRVVGAQELLKAVWGYEGEENEARELVKVHVRQIRRRLGLEAQHADYVQSVRGFGYLVTPPEGT
ncbi:MAG TPA: response regulator transcription factor [Anaerolineae bacterium]|nr:response regulator transcription factor [Anaerolineae bacterium]